MSGETSTTAGWGFLEGRECVDFVYQGGALSFHFLEIGYM